MSREGDQPADATSAPPDPDATPGTTRADATTADEPLGEPGKRALDAERKLRKQAESRLADLEHANLRSAVMTEKGLSESQAKYVTGASREEMETSADELLAAFAPTPPSGNDPRRPREKLRSGASNGEDAGPDASKVADRIFNRGF